MFISALLVSCLINPKVEHEFSGERILRKMATASDSRMSGHSSFFLFGGSSSFKSQEDTKVFFSWMMNNGEYQISSVPITKVRVKFDEGTEAPKIVFVFQGGRTYSKSQDITDSYSDVQYFLDSYLVYLKIIVKEADWKMDIRLPFNDSQALGMAN